MLAVNYKICLSSDFILIPLQRQNSAWRESEKAFSNFFINQSKGNDMYPKLHLRFAATEMNNWSSSTTQNNESSSNIKKKRKNGTKWTIACLWQSRIFVVWRMIRNRESGWRHKRGMSQASSTSCSWKIRKRGKSRVIFPLFHFPPPIIHLSFITLQPESGERNEEEEKNFQWGRKKQQQ